MVFKTPVTNSKRHGRLLGAHSSGVSDIFLCDMGRVYHAIFGPECVGVDNHCAVTV